MFCTNCGFENPAEHHFCGMCGTPLPQRPITAQGAQSTADLTRHPVSQSAESSVVNLHSSTAVQTTEVPSTASDGPNYFTQAESAESLEQFIAGFHYAPPSEEDEVTMTGAKPELDSEVKYEPPTPIGLSEEPPAVEAMPQTAEAPPAQMSAADDEAFAESTVEPLPVVIEPPPFATKGIKDQPPERSGFLDFSEPEEEAPATITDGSIGGPSFLGLSDPPASPAYIAEEAAPPQSHWRVWAALTVILVFAVLGMLEWRAEKNQSGNGPIGIMKMQLDRLKGKKTAASTPTSPDSNTATPAAGASQPPTAGPQMQVAPQQKPQNPTSQPATTPQTQEKPANPGAAANPTSKTQAASTKTSPAPATSPQAENNAAQSAETAASKPEKLTKPGSDELAKAANASDAAAASAWLWKSVAKGNPEAPIKLANMYIKGDGVPQSCEQALVLLRSASAKDNAPARSRLGSLYASGTCVQKSRVKAYQYITLALEANPQAAWPRQFKQQLWTQMTSQERQQAQQ